MHAFVLQIVAAIEDIHQSRNEMGEKQVYLLLTQIHPPQGASTTITVDIESGAGIGGVTEHLIRDC